MVVKVLVVAEYYPRADDPVLGVWAHRQAVAARDAGADVRVLVLHRPIPPLAAVRARDRDALRAAVHQPARAALDGIEISYLRYVSPPRPWSYQSWGAWAAPVLAPALRHIRRSFRFDLVHAHYAVPAGDAVRRAYRSAPLVVSVHGHDVQGVGAGGRNVRAALAHARLVLANSAGTAERCRAIGARQARVVHLGTDVPARTEPPPSAPTLVSVAHLADRKRHEDVIGAVALLRGRHPGLRYVIVGAGPAGERLQALARSLVVDDLVEFRGALPHEQAVQTARAATLFVLPSVDEAFGVAYVEAMAGGVPAIGCQGEDGPQEIAAAGGGIALVPPRDPRALAAAIDGLLRDPGRLESLGHEARATVEREFTWEACGRETVDAYEQALGYDLRAGR
ncbi:MAG TPA: glycosyltransferase [Solirubrobacteraceae bacterium]